MTDTTTARVREHYNAAGLSDRTHYSRQLRQNVSFSYRAWAAG